MTTSRSLRLAPALLLALACAVRPLAEPAPPPAPAAAPPRVVIETAAGSSLTVAVELAPEAGMLFIFSENEPRAFWMKNTLLPLDMLFIDDGGRVVGLIERAEPLTTSPRDPGVPSRYVLEVNGGWAARHGVRPGDRIRFENVPRF